jgi:hypothetical protein
MKYNGAKWTEKRKSGFLRYLFFDGIVIAGGPFAVIMQVVGYFLLRDESQTFGEYFSSSRTWITFFLHATLFGSAIGFINWYRNEKTYRS